ncbi:hypothetical protein DFA_08398 [Cavenderia fasciculata]|uniref:NAD-dependent epimerase/dehydratase domain-containing protein n=1 Tax=Cavenderia fasciculata TaxID=261658 RepID=F4Q5Z4_CACFS|nr:uncharacterized protein DFA_08398 [Cavenderia fasciculata]EGG17403.1 hypothetical protein DFA_08398 [Cavenderia fasciculata]|eukprot:XP_004355887.1 hypothetical protein DFA_08398 [Cavenderia fasciculata]
MSSVLVLGSTGSVGLAVATSFVKEGYRVYGVTRTQAKAALLFSNQITPIVVGDIKETDKWTGIAEKVDIIVEAVNEIADQKAQFVVYQAIKTVVDKSAKNSKLVFYTSGASVYGEVLDGAITENTPYNPHPFLVERAGLQRDYEKLGAVIVQPSFVTPSIVPYYNQLISAAKDGVITTSGTVNQYHGYVHPQDLANFYVLAAKNGTDAVRGQVFIVNAYNESVSDLLLEFAKAQGLGQTLTKVQFVKPADLLSEFVGISQKVSSAKAHNVLGWYPKQLPIVENAKIYLQTWANEKAKYDDYNHA